MGSFFDNFSFIENNNSVHFLNCRKSVRNHNGSFSFHQFIGAMGVLALILIPFGVHVPDATGWFWIVVSGMTFIVSLWVFFAALRAGEASRVVPIIGSLIPILTLAGTTLFLGERLTQSQLLAFGLLIVATVILSGGAAHSRLTRKTVGLAIFAAAVFAFSSVAGKIAYESDGFLTTFAISRIAGALAAVLILCIDRGAARELKASLFGGRRTGRIGTHTAVVLVFVRSEEHTSQ